MAKKKSKKITIDLKTLVIAGIIAVVVFVGVWFGVGLGVSSKKEKAYTEEFSEMSLSAAQVIGGACLTKEKGLSALTYKCTDSKKGTNFFKFGGSYKYYELEYTSDDDKIKIVVPISLEDSAFIK